MTTEADPNVPPPPDTLGYRPRGANNDWARPAPRFGVASTLCLVVTATLYVAVIGIGHLIWTTYPEVRTLDRIWRPYHISEIGLLLHAVGVFLGFAGIVRNERRRSAAIGGFTMNIIAGGIWLLVHGFSPK